MDSDKLIMLIFGAMIIVCVTILAALEIAPWEDAYAIYLVILTGLGFLTAGYYIGRRSSLQ